MGRLAHLHLACCKCSLDSSVDKMFTFCCPLTRSAALLIRAAAQRVPAVACTPPARRSAQHKQEPSCGSNLEQCSAPREGTQGRQTGYMSQMGTSRAGAAPSVVQRYSAGRGRMKGPPSWSLIDPAPLTSIIMLLHGRGGR